MASWPFLFSDDPSSLQGVDTLVVTLPPGLSDKVSLLARYAEGLRFPQYFGWNWDALDECLRDLSWITENGVLIVHRDVPLTGSIADQKIYLEILAGAVRDWSKDASQRFTVTFPLGLQNVFYSLIRD